MEDDQQFCLRWNNHQSTLVAVFDTLLENGTLVDCTLAAEGKYLNAHKVVLSACSPYFESLLSQNYDKHPIFILKDVKYQELKAMMDYMYRGEVNISQDQLGALLKAAESLQIKGLSDNRKGETETRKTVAPPPPPAKSPPPTTSIPRVQGLTIEQRRREMEESREGSQSPGARKKKRIRRRSLDDLVDNHHDASNSSESHHSSQAPAQNIPTTLPAAPSKLTTDVPEPIETKSDILTRHKTTTESEVPQVPIIKEKVETHSELMLEPKAEYIEEMNEDSIEDLTLDDDDISNMEQMDDQGAGPSHGNMGEGSGQGFGGWHMGNQSQDEVFLAAQEAVGAHRDSQGDTLETVIEKLHTWNFPELTDRFLRNGIDIDAFNNLSEENIKELIPKLGVRINFLNKYKIYKREILNDIISDNLHIKHVLRSSYQGRSLTLHYAKNKELGRSQRKQLVDLILNYICQLSPTKFTLTNEHFENIAEKIVTEFPTEIRETYYIPPVKKVKSKIGKSEPARGKLVDRYRNIRYKLQKSGVIQCQPEQNETTSTVGKEVRESLEWLQTRNDPWDEVLKHWKKTHPIRAACKSTTAAEFLEEWPLLKHCNGPTLIDVDFEIKYGKYVLTLEKLNDFFEKLLSVRSTYVTDKQAIVYVELLKGNLSKNAKVTIQLELLSHLIPPRGRTKSSGIIKKPSIAESAESIIIKVDSSDEVERTIERKRLQQSGPAQPYIITDGTSGRAFVVIDVVRYSFENVLRAFEIAFKAFHVMNVRYPPESQHIWYVLQVALFKIETCWDRPIPYVMDILSKF